jgi:hypothetical protein
LREFKQDLTKAGAKPEFPVHWKPQEVSKPARPSSLINAKANDGGFKATIGGK